MTQGISTSRELDLRLFVRRRLGAETASKSIAVYDEAVGDRREYTGVLSILQLTDDVPSLSVSPS